MKRTSILIYIPIIIGIIVGSWFMVHIMAVSGFFLAIAYIIFSFFFTNRSICFVCHLVPKNKKCPACGGYRPFDDSYRPKSVRSIFLNSLFIILLTVLSLGLVYFEAGIIHAAGIVTYEKSVSFQIPEKNTYKLDQIFPMDIKLTGIKTAINTIQVDLAYNPEALEVINISTSDSFASVFLQKDFNNTLGYCRISGGLPSPGYSEDTGIFATVYFKGKSAGLTQITFLPTSMVLANDGEGSNVLSSFGEAIYIIKPEELSEEEQSLQEQIFVQEVFGIQDPNTSELNACKIDAETSSSANVLGVTDTIESSLDSQVSLWTKFWKLTDKFDDFSLNIISTLSQFFSKIIKSAY